MIIAVEKDTLFLHGGPGFNAHAERQVLCEKSPNVNFWDQPPVHTTRDAFRILMDAAVAEVEKMCEARRGPIKLMANSFAAHLVSGLLERIPHRISACYLFGAVYDIPAAYLNLLGIMANSQVTDGDLRARISAFIGNRTRHTADKDKIWDYYDLIISAADFMRYYWPRKAQYDAWNACVSNGPDFDSTTLRNVMNDFLLHHYERRFTFAGSQEIIIELGDRDPLLVLGSEMRLWARRFPSAQIIIRRGSGHFIHLEPYF